MDVDLGRTRAPVESARLPFPPISLAPVEVVNILQVDIFQVQGSGCQ